MTTQVDVLKSGGHLEPGYALCSPPLHSSLHCADVGGRISVACRWVCESERTARDLAKRLLATAACKLLWHRFTVELGVCSFFMVLLPQRFLNIL